LLLGRSPENLIQKSDSNVDNNKLQSKNEDIQTMLDDLRAKYHVEFSDLAVIRNVKQKYLGYVINLTNQRADLKEELKVRDAYYNSKDPIDQLAVSINDKKPHVSSDDIKQILGQQKELRDHSLEILNMIDVYIRSKKASSAT
jgi:hypothetical protein